MASGFVACAGFQVPMNHNWLDELRAVDEFVPKAQELEQLTSESTSVALTEPAVTNEMKSGRALILIVDDDRVTVKVLDRLLREAGFGTVSAGELSSAEQVLHTHTISLVLLDVHLPDGNGLDFCARVASSAKFADVPVLFISSSGDEATKVRGFASGAVDYITKPLASGEVLARVRTHLRLRTAYESLTRMHAERIEQIAVSQQSLMPSPESLPEAKFHVCIRQFDRAGGDFYDVFVTGDRTADYVIADASGHNLGVSLWTASFKTLLAEYATVLNTPPEIFRMINRTLLRVLPDAAYFTAIYARLNREFGALTLVNAGHPPALLVSLDGTVQVLEQEGDLVGIFPDPVFGVVEVRVRPGDRLFLYTDGLIELSGPRELGLERLVEACRETIELTLSDAVPAIVDRMCADVEPEDDIILQGICV